MGVRCYPCANPGMLPQFACKRSRQNRATFAAESVRALPALAHPCANRFERTDAWV